MTTVVLKIPDKKENYFLNLFKKHRLKSRVLREDEDEDLMAKWIDEANETTMIANKHKEG